MEQEKRFSEFQPSSSHGADFSALATFTVEWLNAFLTTHVVSARAGETYSRMKVFDEKPAPHHARQGEV